MSKTISISLIIVLIAVGLIWFVSSRQQANPDTLGIGTITTTSKRCGLTVSSPLSNTAVTAPVAVTAIVNNSNPQGCTWTVFEAQAGSVALIDSSGNTIGTSVLSTSDDWMTSGPVPYTASITPTRALISGEALSLVFTEEDVSGMGNVDTLSVPLVAQ